MLVKSRAERARIAEAQSNPELGHGDFLLRQELFGLLYSTRSLIPLERSTRFAQRYVSWD
jgi:hypothetical protein